MRYISDTDLSRRLMDQVSAMKAWQVGKVSSSASRCYFDWLEFLVKGFWTYIVDLASLSGDSTIYFCDFEQAQAGTFAKRFFLYPVVQLDTKMTESEYITAINKEPGTVQEETFAVANTNAYVIFPASAKWYVHGEYSIEMAELVSFVGLPSPGLFPHDFLDESEALRRVESVK